MVRFPTFEEYEERRNFGDGVRRCDQLLARQPNDVRLLATKLRLLAADNDTEKAQSVLETLVSFKGIHELSDLLAIEDGALEIQRDIYPPPTSAGPLMAKLWDHAIKSSSSPRSRLELISTRWERAVWDSRKADMQQTLIQLKALDPKNRTFYMAHAALTQMLSSSNNDLQARLAISLARKAVSDKFDADRKLDCRVAGQIFAIQGSQPDLENIKDRPRLRESQQVFDAMRKQSEEDTSRTTTALAAPDPTSMSTNEWLSAEIASMKQEFQGLIEQQAPVPILRVFATTTIRLFQSSLETLNNNARRLPAEACFLAVSSLVRLFDLTNHPSYLLHSAYLSEALLRHNPHVHEARLILIYLYMRAGLGSLAIRMFESLKVKEIQHDTIGHALFTRLSLRHPHATLVGRSEALDPQKRIKMALDVYTRCEDRLAECETAVLSTEQTGMLFDLQNLRDSLRQSLSRRITLLEWRRIGRLMKATSDWHDAMHQMGPPLVDNWLQGKDTRDFDAAFNFDYNVEKALYGSAGAVPGKLWILYALVADTIWSTSRDAVPPVRDAEKLLLTTAELASHNASHLAGGRDVAGSSGLTAAEQLAGILSLHTYRLLLCYHPSTGALHKKDEKDLAEIVADTISGLERLDIVNLIAQSDMLTGNLLKHYVFADAVRNVMAVCGWIKKRSGLSEQLRVLETRAKHQLNALLRHAEEEKAHSTATEARKLLSSHDDVVFAGLLKFGAEHMDAFCGDVAEAAAEGWEGVTRIKASI